ncbi:MAG: xanthine dehydrogenase family protein molybdopterin-binding subunit, partial [Thaumarchaeota archaeon]|nr:xanthine dehydrogenase family protein molybdopterin-binding subunit [Nitrososphaerota archaeon]
MKFIGKSIPRIDGTAKVTGQTGYVSDIELPGMLYGKILRSPYPHAKIKKIDTSRAEKIQGVVSTVQLKERSGKNSLLRKKLRVDIPLYDDRVRYVGDEVAAVAALDPDTAEVALDEITVEYEDLPPIFDPHEALRKGAPSIREGGNTAFHQAWGFGDYKSQLKRSEVVLQETFNTQRQAHVCLETKGCIASWDPSDTLTIISTTSGPHVFRNDISQILDVPLSKVRILNPPMGAAYGGRVSARMVDVTSCLLARNARRPVKIVNSREEEFLSARTRYPYEIDIKVGADGQGHLLAWDVKVIGSNGAYNDTGPYILAHSYRVLEEGYNPRSAHFDASLVYTNTQPGTAMRGFGEPQIIFAVESMMDLLAQKLGIDSADLRLLNASKPRSTNYSGAKIRSNGLSECIKKATTISGWHNRGQRRKGQTKIGFGISVSPGSGGGSRRYGYNAA